MHSQTLLLEVESETSDKLDNLIREYRNTVLPAPLLMDIVNSLDKVNVNLPLPNKEKINYYLEGYTYPISTLTFILSICKDNSYLPVIQRLLDKGARSTILDLYFICMPEIYPVIQPLLKTILEKFNDETTNHILDEEESIILHKLAEANCKIPDEIIYFLLEKGTNVQSLKKNKGCEFDLKNAITIASENAKYNLFAILLPFHPELNEIVKSYYNKIGIYYEQAYQNSLNSSDKEFEIAINEFLILNNLKTISDIFKVQTYPTTWLSVSNHYFSLLLNSFYANHSIMSYLTREEIRFNQDLSPQYHVIEKEFYNAAEVYNIDGKLNQYHYIPYRNKVKNNFSLSKANKSPYSFFYSDGTHADTIKLYIEMIEKSVANLSCPYIKIIFPRDIYELGYQIKKMSNDTLENNVNGYTYVISATTCSDHIFCTLSIINTMKKDIHFHMVINSWINLEYFQQINGKINHNNLSDPDHVLDGSISIQKDNTDGNCGLYTTSICGVLYHVISNNSELQARLEALHPGNIQEWEQLRPYFHSCLQEKLPEFFYKSGNGYEAKSYNELIQFHLKKRWAAGNLFLFKQHQKAKEEINQDYESWKKISSMVNK